MKYSRRTIALTFTGVFAIGVAASGCATPWFGKSTTTKSDTAAATNRPGDLKQVTATYISGICKLPKEQRDTTFRELNEALLPNHAVISCGPGADL